MQTINESLLSKYLAHQTDTEESELVRIWLAESEANRKELIDYQLIWDKSVEIDEEIELDTDLAWNKIKSKIITTKVVEFSPQKSFWNPVRIAASITLLISSTLILWMLMQDKDDAISFQTSKNTLDQMLPDGSKVFLNQNTELTYQFDSEKNIRTVKLIGEAFFEVKRDEANPFVINANGTEVKVLGTSFNVKAYTKNVSVNVESGKVQFATKKQKAILEKGEEAAFVATKDSIIKRFEYNKNVLAYKTKSYIFEDSSLEHIIKTLSEGYQAEILFKNNSIKSCRLTTKFENESLPNALNVIAETLNLQVSKNGDKYLLDGSGCK